MSKNTLFNFKQGFGYRVLTFLYNNRDKKVYGSLIAKDAIIAEANISPLLIKLEQLGLIKRTINSKSRRMKHLSLTNEGIRLTKLLLQVDILLSNQKQKLK